MVESLGGLGVGFFGAKNGAPLVADAKSDMTMLICRNDVGTSKPIGSMYGIYIYANIGGILMVNVTIYSSTIDPMGNSLETLKPMEFCGSQAC